MKSNHTSLIVFAMDWTVLLPNARVEAVPPNMTVLEKGLLEGNEG